MIPADILADRLKLSAELLTRPSATLPVQRLPADVLNELKPGQRLMATIQSLLPNGAYRAEVAGRELTLALPFAAQTGERLELEVVEQNGKATLAVVAERAGQAAARGEGEANSSVATRLTVAGRLISELLGALDKDGGKRPQPAPLNNAQPVVSRFPADAADLAPALKAALAKSGMFYEAHQALWVAGKTTLATLLAEPQGRLSPAAQLGQQAGSGINAGTAAGTATTAASTAAATGGAGNVAAQANAAPQGNAATQSNAAPAAASVATNAASNTASSAASNATTSMAGNTATSGMADGGALRVSMGQIVARELTPLVQQQLEALATNTYVWQGQVWPGQNMDWEIVEEDGGREKSENTAPNWTTRLRLTLPRLGGVDATLRLIGGKEIEIKLRAENPATRALLNAANGPLRQQFVTAGLKLSAFAVSRPRAEQSHEPPEEA